jgi:hypothetical protein
MSVIDLTRSGVQASDPAFSCDPEGSHVFAGDFNGFELVREQAFRTQFNGAFLASRQTGAELPQIAVKNSAHVGTDQRRRAQRGCSDPRR